MMVDIDKVVARYKQSVHCLRLELPNAVWADVSDISKDLIAALEQSQKWVAELEAQLYFASLPKAELESTRWDNEPRKETISPKDGE